MVAYQRLVVAVCILATVQASIQNVNECRAKSSSKITCPHNQVIRIKEATYGRQDSTTCKYLIKMNSRCTANVTENLKKICEGKTKCSAYENRKEIVKSGECTAHWFVRRYYFSVKYSCEIEPPRVRTVAICETDNIKTFKCEKPTHTVSEVIESIVATTRYGCPKTQKLTNFSFNAIGRVIYKQHFLTWDKLSNTEDKSEIVFNKEDFEKYHGDHYSFNGRILTIQYEWDPIESKLNKLSLPGYREHHEGQRYSIQFFSSDSTESVRSVTIPYGYRFKTITARWELLLRWPSTSTYKCLGAYVTDKAKQLYDGKEGILEIKKAHLQPAGNKHRCNATTFLYLRVQCSTPEE